MKKYKALILSIIACWSYTVNAQFIESKTIKKSGLLDKDGIVRISNKHGNVNVTSWDKDSVVFEITITCKSNSPDKAVQQLGLTNVEIHMSSFFTEATTLLNQSTISKEWRKVRKIVVSKDEQIQVMMNVKVPKKAKLEIINSFGNVYLGNHEGELEFDIKHGNLRAGMLNKIEKLDGSFCNIFIREARNCKANLTFSEFDIKKIETITITSRNSKLDIDLVYKLDLSSTNDRVDIEDVQVLKYIGKLSKLSVGKVHSSIYTNAQYGSIDINSFVCNLQSFVIKMNSGTVDVGIYSSCGMNLTAIGPALTLNFNAVKNSTTNEGDSITGKIGNDIAHGKITITGSQSAINFYNI